MLIVLRSLRVHAPRAPSAPSAPSEPSAPNACTKCSKCSKCSECMHQVLRVHQVLEYMHQVSECTKLRINACACTTSRSDRSECTKCSFFSYDRLHELRVHHEPQGQPAKCYKRCATIFLPKKTRRSYESKLDSFIKVAKAICLFVILERKSVIRLLTKEGLSPIEYFELP